MTIRVLVVDDEPLAREGVLFHLRNECDVEIVGECRDGSEAVRAIREQSPDLVFLDIKMPKVGGFAVIEKVGADKMPLVIFLTAFEEHAVEAFRANAVDYLLKPLDSDQFRQGLQRARARVLSRQRGSMDTTQLNDLLAALTTTGKSATSAVVPPRIAIKVNGQIHFLQPDQLDWVEAEGDYVTVHTAERSYLVRETMQAMEQRLDAYGFQRIHRSAIVNLRKIEKLSAGDNGDQEVRLTKGALVKVGRNYRDALFKRMKIDS